MLWRLFRENTDKVIFKMNHYFPIYQRHFSKFQDDDIVFLEIGVNHGGSLSMWSKFFGPRATIIGIDINPSCKIHEDKINRTFVRIGDQSDPKFLQSIIDEFGIPDAILDDGSHQMDHVLSSFNFFYKKMNMKAVYMVEDMHTAYFSDYGGGLESPNNFINISKNYIDQLNAMYTNGQLDVDWFTSSTFGISFYNSIVCFEKGRVDGSSQETGSIRM